MAAYPFPEFWELQQAGQYDNSIPTLFLAPIDRLKIPALKKNPPLDGKMAAYPFPEFWELQQAGRFSDILIFCQGGVLKSHR